jgi:exosortase
MLVPFAAMYLLWQDRARLSHVKVQPAWIGLIVVVLAQAARLFGLAFLFESAERYSMVLTLAGLVILMGGWQLFRATAHILAFLLLAIPLPGALHNHISSPLQNLATSGAVATLELLGVVVSQEGNTLLLDHRVPVAVAEACSGLRMLTAFVFVSALLAFVVARPRWQKAVILLSSVPIAFVANLVRLVITALLFLWTSDAVANRFFHDFAGWTMMPLAFALLAGELWLMSRLVVEEPR